MGVMASQITSLTIVYSTVYSGEDQRKHQSSTSLAFVWGIHRWLVNSPHKWPVMRKMFPFDDVMMIFPHWDPSLRKIDTRLSRIVNVTMNAALNSHTGITTKFLYMAWQLCCHGMYKHLLWSGRHQQNYSKAKFSSNLNCWQKNHKWKGRQGNVRLEEGNMHLQ